MKKFRVLIYEDDKSWVDGFKFNMEPKFAAESIALVVNHKEDDSTIMQDLEWLPNLILVDHDLGVQVGKDIIIQIFGDPQFNRVSIYYYSGGESIEDLKKLVSDVPGVIHCYSKKGEELENSIFAFGKSTI